MAGQRPLDAARFAEARAGQLRRVVSHAGGSLSRRGLSLPAHASGRGTHRVSISRPYVAGVAPFRRDDGDSWPALAHTPVIVNLVSHRDPEPEREPEPEPELAAVRAQHFWFLCCADPQAVWPSPRCGCVPDQS
jgi:hypothetical protein